jgi:hypothetical protein
MADYVIRNKEKLMAGAARLFFRRAISHIRRVGLPEGR